MFIGFIGFLGFMGFIGFMGVMGFIGFRVKGCAIARSSSDALTKAAMAIETIQESSGRDMANPPAVSQRNQSEVLSHNKCCGASLGASCLRRPAHSL